MNLSQVFVLKHRDKKNGYVVVTGFNVPVTNLSQDWKNAQADSCSAPAEKKIFSRELG